MRFKDIKQHSNLEERHVIVDEDRYGNITVTVTRGAGSATAFNVAPHRVKHAIKKLAKRVK